MKKLLLVGAIVMSNVCSLYGQNLWNIHRRNVNNPRNRVNRANNNQNPDWFADNAQRYNILIQLYRLQQRNLNRHRNLQVAAAG